MFTRTITLFILLKGYSPCKQSTLWVYFFSQICYHDKSKTAIFFGAGGFPKTKKKFDVINEFSPYLVIVEIWVYVA